MAAHDASRYTLTLAIKIVLNKYLDHIPLERQARIMDRHGLVITSQTCGISRTHSHTACSASTRRCSITSSRSL